MPRTAMDKTIKNIENTIVKLQHKIELFKFVRRLTPQSPVLDYGKAVSVNSTPDGKHFSNFTIVLDGNTATVTHLDTLSVSIHHRVMTEVDTKFSLNAVSDIYRTHAHKHAELLDAEKKAN